MKRVVTILCACAFLMILGARAYAQAPGESCETAIPLGKDYKAPVVPGQSVWYSAWTFDLPLSVYFAPRNGEFDPAPEVEMDFSCTSGYYEDSVLCSLFCKTSGSSGITIDMPHKPVLKTKYLEDNTFVYYISLGKQYRDMLLKMGISYNLEVFVKVTYNSAGNIAIAPDSLFTNCVDGAKFMHLGDTVRVAAKDEQRHVIVPYIQWQEDTIVYKWNGTSSCVIAVANTCDFDPKDNENEDVLNYVQLSPGGSYKITATQLVKYVSDQKNYPNEAGMYFAKFYSEEPGVIKIEKVPQSPPRKNATILRYDRTYPLNANDTAVFAIPKSWDNDKVDSKFSSPTQHLFRMIIATDPDFEEEHIINQYEFEKTPKGRWKGIHGEEMHGLWTHAKEQYLYVKFVCSEATTITPSEWDELKCEQAVTITTINSLDAKVSVKRGSTGGYYKVNYSRYVGGDLTFTFSSKKKCTILVATDCNITLAADAENLLYYKQLTTSTNTATVPAEEVASWAERVNEEGYIFMRFHHTESIGSYSMRIQSEAPADADPVYPSSTISVVCESDQVVVHVSEPQTITVYDMNDVVCDTWDATPGTPHVLSLPAKKYTLQGKTEKIELNL